MTADGGAPGPGGDGDESVYLPPVTSGVSYRAARAEARAREERRRRLLLVGGWTLGAALVGGLAVWAAGPAGKPAAAPPPPATAPSDGSSSPAASAPPSASPPESAAPPSATRGGKAGGSAGPGAGGQSLAGLVLGAGSAIGPSDGHNGPTLVLHGNDVGYADSRTPLVDTTRSFTVAALVRNNAPTGGRAAVTQGGDASWSFYLGRDDPGGRNQWVFKVRTAPGAQDDTTYRASSVNPAGTGQWTLLTGVYDAGSRRIQLYVDGALQQTTPVTGIWQTTGGLELGRGRVKSAWADFWDGAIAEVQLWNQALPASAVARLHGSGGTGAGTAAARSWLLP